MSTQLLEKPANFLPPAPAGDISIDKKLADANADRTLSDSAVAALNEVRANSSDPRRMDVLAEEVIKNAKRIGPPPEIPEVPKIPARYH